jgi:hypothetical protein
LDEKKGFGAFMSDSKSTEERVEQFMESMGFEQTMLGNYSGHDEMISYDAALLFEQELDSQVKEAERFNYDLGYKDAEVQLAKQATLTKKH